MPEQMHYATYGRPARRAANRNQLKPSAARSKSDREKNEQSSLTKRRSDPDGAYCISREEHCNAKRHDSRGRNDSRAKQRPKQQPAQRKSDSDATDATHRQRCRANRSPSPQPSRAASSRQRSSSRPSRACAAESFKRQRGSSLKSCGSARSTAKSEAPTLTSELTGFDLSVSNKAAVNRGKRSLFNRISGLSILGGCNKKTPRRQRPVARHRANSISARTTTSSTARRYQLQDGSCTHTSDDDVSSSSSSWKSESESEFNSSYESFSISDSSSDDESFQSLRESEEAEIYQMLHKSTGSFVENGFVSDDDISGAQELHDSADDNGKNSPSISTKSRALIQILEAENEALRASVVALRSDWEIVVKKMAGLQNGDTLAPDEVTDKSPNMDAVRDLRNLAMNALNNKQTQDIIERNKREADLKSCIECVEDLLCENERLYDNILKLSQERENILQELSTLRKQAVTSLEESHHSLIQADENSDDIEALLTKAKKVLSEDQNGLNNMEDEIVQLLKRVMTQRADIETRRSSSAREDDAKDAATDEPEANLENSALVVRDNSSRRSSRRDSTGSNINNEDAHEAVTRRSRSIPRSSCCSGSSSRRRSSYYTEDETEDHSLRKSSNYIEKETDCSSYRSSFCSESSGRRSYYSESSRHGGDSDFLDNHYYSVSESDVDDGPNETHIINASTNSLFDGDGPSSTSTEDVGYEDSSSNLQPIYEIYDSSESDSYTSSEEDVRASSPMCPKKKSFFGAVSRLGAVRSVTTRIRNKNKRRRPRYLYTDHIDDTDGLTKDSSRRSSENTILTDVEPTDYPDMISPSSVSSSKSSSRGSSRSQRASTCNTRHLESSFTSIPEDDEMSFEKDRSRQYSPRSQGQRSASPEKEEEEIEEDQPTDKETDQPEYSALNFSIGEDYQASYATQSPGNAPERFSAMPPRTASTCASVSHGEREFDDDASFATSGSESTKERKGISITVVSRSSRFLTLPSSRSHTYMTFFTASLLKNQIDDVLYEQYHNSMREIIGSMSSIQTELASGARKKRQKYQGDLNEDGERHGYGIYKSKNGNEYRGEWNKNKREGLGVVKIGNGDVFEGQFEANMKNGVGVYHYTDGECDLSRYTDDRRVGESLRYSKDRKKVYLLSEDLSSKEISITDAAIQARSMGVIIQL